LPTALQSAFLFLPLQRMTDRLLHCSISAPVTQSPRLELLSSIRKTFSHSLDRSPPSLPLPLHLLHRPRRALHRCPHTRARILHPPFPTRHPPFRVFLDLHSFPHFFRLARRSFRCGETSRGRIRHLVRVHFFHGLLARIR